MKRFVLFAVLAVVAVLIAPMGMVPPAMAATIICAQPATTPEVILVTDTSPPAALVIESNSLSQTSVTSTTSLNVYGEPQKANHNVASGASFGTTSPWCSLKKENLAATHAAGAKRMATTIIIGADKPKVAQIVILHRGSSA